MFINHNHVAPVNNAWGIRRGDPMFSTVERFVEILDRVGVERAVVFPLYDHHIMTPSDCRELNDWLSNKLKDYDHLVPFLTLDPKHSDAVPLAKEFAAKGFKGVKYHPPVFETPINDPKNERFYSACEALGLTILIHTGAHVSTPWPLRFYNPLLIDEVAMNHPGLKIIVEHLGGFDFIHEAVAVVKNNPKCFAGLTSFSGIPAGMLNHVFTTKCAGTFLNGSRPLLKDKLIFGTDFPNREPQTEEMFERELCLSKELNLSQADLDNIFGGTLQRLLEEE